MARCVADPLRCWKLLDQPVPSLGVQEPANVRGNLSALLRDVCHTRTQHICSHCIALLKDIPKHSICSASNLCRETSPWDNPAPSCPRPRSGNYLITIVLHQTGALLSGGQPFELCRQHTARVTPAQAATQRLPAKARLTGLIPTLAEQSP